MALRRERLARSVGSMAVRWDSALAAARLLRAESVARAFKAAKRARRSVLEDVSPLGFEEDEGSPDGFDGGG